MQPSPWERLRPQLSFLSICLSWQASEGAEAQRRWVLQSPPHSALRQGQSHDQGTGPLWASHCLCSPWSSPIRLWRGDRALQVEGLTLVTRCHPTVSLDQWIRKVRRNMEMSQLIPHPPKEALLCPTWLEQNRNPKGHQLPHHPAPSP